MCVSLIAHKEITDLHLYQPIIELSYGICNKLEREKEAGAMWLREDSYCVVAMTHWLFNDEQIKGCVPMVTERSLGHCILDNSQDQQIDGKVKDILNSYIKKLVCFAL